MSCSEGLGGAAAHSTRSRMSNSQQFRSLGKRAATHHLYEHAEQQGGAQHGAREDPAPVKVVLSREALPVLGCQPVQPLREEDDSSCKGRVAEADSRAREILRHLDLAVAGNKRLEDISTRAKAHLACHEEDDALRLPAFPGGNRRQEDGRVKG